MNGRRVFPSSRRRFLGGTLATIAAASPLARASVSAQRQGGPFVLVHGAWHGGWCWRRVADRLTAKGRYVVAPTLTGVRERSHQASESISLSTHIEDVVNEIKRSTPPGATPAPLPEYLVRPISAATFRVNAKDAAWVDGKMTPHPRECFTEPLRVTGAYASIAQTIYIRATDYPSSPFDAALGRCKADRAWTTIEMKCSAIAMHL